MVRHTVLLNFVLINLLKNKNNLLILEDIELSLISGAPKFFKQMKKIFKDLDFKITSSKEGYVFYINDIVCGYGLTLSTCQDLKGSDYEGVKNIIFDEFIIEKGQKKYYLKDEVTNFLGLIETLIRTRPVRVLMLANSANSINPYFLYFNLKTPYNSDIQLFKSGTILVQCMTNKAYREEKKKTPFGVLVSGTDYEDYAIDNKWMDESDRFIEKKTANSRFAFAFKYKEHTLGVWNDYNVGKVFVSFDYDPQSYYIYALTLEDHSENTMLISTHSKFIYWKNFITHYQLGCVRFENTKVSTLMNEIIRMILKPR